MLEDYAVLDGPELGDRPLLLASWTRHAVSEVTVHDLATGAPLDGDSARVALPGHRLGRRARRAARGRARDVVHLHRPHHPSARLPLRRARRHGGALQQPAGRRRGATGRRAAGVVHARRTARPCGCSCCAREAGSRRRPRPPAILYGYGGFGVSLDARVLREHPRLGRGGRRLRRGESARRRRGGRGLAPGRDARATSRTSSTTSTRRPSVSSRTAGRRAGSSRSAAARTAGCWSAPR